PEGAREVSRELLPAIDRGLRSISTQLSEVLAAEQRDPRARSVQRAREQLAGQVTTVFLQHTELAATVRDFYAYLGQVVNRHQLAPDEISGFRNLLVEYIQMVVEDVLRHTESDRKSTRLNSSHVKISYAVFCLKKKKNKNKTREQEEHRM